MFPPDHVITLGKQAKKQFKLKDIWLETPPEQAALLEVEPIKAVRRTEND